MAQIKDRLKNAFTGKYKWEIPILSACSLFLAMVGLFYFFPTEIGVSASPLILLFSFTVFLIIAFGSQFFFLPKTDLLQSLGKMLIVLFPFQIILLYALQSMPQLSFWAGAAGALYFAVAAFYVVSKDLSRERVAAKTEAGIRKKPNGGIDRLLSAIILFVMIISFASGAYGIGRMAVVDEPLWTFDRTPNFWRDVLEKDWRGARVSDKPGLTTAAISGFGLLFEKNPKQFKNIKWQEETYNANAGEMESFNMKFRLPLFLFTVLMLPFFYWLLKVIFGKIPALFSVIFIGLSPIIIGNARIINPDGLLWIFTSLSIFGYFAHLKEKNKKYLYFSALMLGLGTLTKYTANILYIFFFALIFAEYIFYCKKYAQLKFAPYFKSALSDYAKLVLISLAVFYVFYPAVWEKPDRLLIGTIYSQAFEPIWPLFSSLLGIAILDLFILKGSLLSFAVNKLCQARKWILAGIAAVFLFGIFATAVNVYSGMKFFDFETILASPKSSYSFTDPLGMFLANFYPLIFGISSLAIAAVFVLFLGIILRRNFEEEGTIRLIWLAAFIIVYYLGSVFSHVASIIRYQIILYPIILVLAGTALGILFEKYSAKTGMSRIILIGFSSLILIGGLSIVLLRVHPFFMGYASSLLPQKYFLDTKDMGDGSYEAARHLNSLPEAGKMKIWTDKRGVCVFFIGQCYSTLTAKFFKENQMDFFVLSSGRESRVSKIGAKILVGDSVFLPELYLEKEKVEYQLEINNRPKNYVKIVRVDAITDRNKNADKELRAAIITDIDHCPSRAAASEKQLADFLQFAKENRADFIASLGDNASHRLRDCSKTGDMDARYIADFLRSSGLPVHMVLGDHDIASEVESYKNWLKTAGREKTFYSLDLKNFHIIIIDTVLGGEPMSPPCEEDAACEPILNRLNDLQQLGFESYRQKYADSRATLAEEKKIITKALDKAKDRRNITRSWGVRDRGQILENELRWLEKDLRTTQYSRVLILSDHPLFKFSSPRKNYDIANGEEIRAILRESGKNIVAISGEAHLWHEEKQDNVQYYIIDEFRKANGSWAYFTWNQQGFRLEKETH